MIIDDVKAREAEFSNNHKFLAEELLIPGASMIDGSRINMFDSHIAQTVMLEDPDIPRIFTNFENQVGKYSNAYKTMDKTYKIIGKFVKNKYNVAYVIKNLKTNYVDIIFREEARVLTETYGYRLNNEVLDSKSLNSLLTEGETIYHSTAYDKDLNFMYGKNLMTAFISMEGKTMEDSIVISESAANKMVSYSVDTITANINLNDSLVNLYGNINFYKTFPDIGEEVKDHILMARRRLDYDTILYEMKTNSMLKLNHNIDQPFYTNGTVIDIDIFCNSDPEDMGNYDYNKQIYHYYKSNMKYYTNLLAMLEKIVTDPTVTYSDDIGYHYKRIKDILDPKVKFTNDKNEFGNMVIRIKTLTRKPVTKGSKITGRYGNKGTISEVLPDHLMPITEDGTRVEICLNSLGIVNRLNPAQLVEHELNFMSEFIRKDIKFMYDSDYDIDVKLASMEDIFFQFMEDVTKGTTDQYKSLKLHYDMELRSIEERLEFFKDIIDDGIYIHQPPFYGIINAERMFQLYDKYPEMKPKKVVGVEQPLIVAPMYFIKLKHEAVGKMSARSTGLLNVKSIPSKSTLMKENLSLYSRTPLRVGEMEFTGLCISNNVEGVLRYLRMNSSNEQDRNAFNTELLTGDPFEGTNIQLSELHNNTKSIIDVYLKNISLRLTDDKETDEESHEG